MKLSSLVSLFALFFQIVPCAGQDERAPREARAVADLINLVPEERASQFEKLFADGELSIRSHRFLTTINRQKEILGSGTLRRSRPPKALGSRVDLPLKTDDTREANVGNNDRLPVQFLEAGHIAQKAVARITVDIAFGENYAGKGLGTGFMISDTLFLTCNHVIPDPDTAKKLKLRFNYQQSLEGSFLEPDVFRLDPDIFFTNTELDFTVVGVKTKTEGGSGEISAGSRWGFLKLLDSLSVREGQRVSVIQHPWGEPKQVALHSSVIMQVRENGFYHTADTQWGSSGAPIFTTIWQIVGIHAGIGDRVNGEVVNNEAVRTDAVLNLISKSMNSNPQAQRIGQILGL